MSSTEILRAKQRLEAITKASETIASSAAALKEVADQLRVDVDALADRVAVVEGNAETVASTLVVEGERVEGQQIKQDGRLDTLES